MRNFRKTFFLAIFSLATIQTSAFANDEVINFEALPQSAQSMIKDNFDSLTIARATYDSDCGDKNYKVVLSDGTKIEFNKAGNWTDIERENAAVPANLVPAPITKYVTKNYADTSIKKIERNKTYFEITLSNNIEITFNDKFKVKETEFDD